MKTLPPEMEKCHGSSKVFAEKYIEGRWTEGQCIDHAAISATSASDVIKRFKLKELRKANQDQMCAEKRTLDQANWEDTDVALVLREESKHHVLAELPKVMEDMRNFKKGERGNNQYSNLTKTFIAQYTLISKMGNLPNLDKLNAQMQERELMGPPPKPKEDSKEEDRPISNLVKAFPV